MAEARRGGAGADVRDVRVRRVGGLPRPGRGPLAAGGAEPRVRFRHQPHQQAVPSADRARGRLRLQAAHLRSAGAAAPRRPRPAKRRTQPGHAAAGAARRVGAR